MPENKGFLSAELVVVVVVVIMISPVLLPH